MEEMEIVSKEGKYVLHKIIQTILKPMWSLFTQEHANSWNYIPEII